MNLPLNTSADIDDPIEHARYNMIEQQIRPWNVLNSEVLETLAQVRRELFVPPACQGMAFSDLEVPLISDAAKAMHLGQHMLAPRVEARLLQELEIQPTDRVLEVGTGSGYMAALLAHRAAHVTTLEIDPEIAEMARENLLGAGVENVQVRVADAASDPISEGPFNVIVLSGSVAKVPEHLQVLLLDGGRLAGIVGELPMMRATVVRRTGNQYTTATPWDVVTTRLRNFPQTPAFQF